MGWVVKRWRTDALEWLLVEEAVAVACSARRAAERDARRARRAADRTAAEAAAELAALERLGAGLQARVRRKRAALRAADHGPAQAAPAGPAAAGATAADATVPGPAPAPGAPLVRMSACRRASMHGSPLSELFRATTAD
jgi:hypothetical protein